ncbi:hypothetical protein A9R00_09440 [Oleispira antarctica]|uniref:Uncharacterized protein n=1 Tax=Oleispira antarctica TaxID=188908 RepID=A0A1Y5HUK4_OLEAN|nr:hypothetical protein A9R00_09440 [Oleispira antarctica]
MSQEVAILAEKVVAITRESGRNGGNILEDIASTQGDQKMIAVISELDIMSVAKILRNFDATIPSIAAWLMDPETIGEMLDVEPSYWENELEKGGVTAQDSVKSMLSQIFLTRTDDEERQADILDAINHTETGLLYLSLPFIGFDFESIDFEEEPVSGSDEELLVKIKSLREPIYKAIVATSKNGDLENIEAILKSQANNIRVGEISCDTDDMFEPL